MKILIVDDHTLFREGICHVLSKLDEQISVGEAADYERAMLYVAENPDLDLVLLDLHIPGKNGFAVLDSLAAQYPTIPVVILSASNQSMDMRRALETGAMGYIPKDTTSTVMLNALRLILNGGVYIPPGMLNQDHQAFDQTNPIVSGLTPRQMQVLALLIKGGSNKEIASQLELAEATVKMHISAILKVLNVTNRTQAAIAVERLGLKLLN